MSSGSCRRGHRGASIGKGSGHHPTPSVPASSLASGAFCWGSLLLRALFAVAGCWGSGAHSGLERQLHLIFSVRAQLLTPTSAVVKLIEGSCREGVRVGDPACGSDSDSPWGRSGRCVCRPSTNGCECHHQL